MPRARTIWMGLFISTALRIVTTVARRATVSSYQAPSLVGRICQRDGPHSFSEKSLPGTLSSSSDMLQMIRQFSTYSKRSEENPIGLLICTLFTEGRLWTPLQGGFTKASRLSPIHQARGIVPCGKPLKPGQKERKCPTSGLERSLSWPKEDLNSFNPISGAKSHTLFRP